MTSLHSGGHPHPGDLVRLVEALAPKRVVPMHTLIPEAFAAFDSIVAELLPGGSPVIGDKSRP